jgi:hypothetical protein
MRLACCLALLLVPWSSNAWDTGPHQRITKAALDAMPKGFVDRLGAGAGALVEIYCMYPDRYLEMEQFGFVRKSPGPLSAAEIRPYCVRGDGTAVHGATGDRDADMASLIFLFERMVTRLSENRPEEAAKYAGVLSHFIADSLSPPHAVAPEELLQMAGGMNVHSVIERRVPELVVSRRARLAGANTLEQMESILRQVYEARAQNRRDLPVIIKAACGADVVTLDRYRLRAGRRAAEILADALSVALRTRSQ